MVDATGTRGYTYNDAGQPLTEGYTAGIMDTLGITNVYDSLLRRQSLAAGNGTTNYLSVGYTYDNASRLATVGSPAPGMTPGKAPGRRCAWLATGGLDLSQNFLNDVSD